MPEQVLTHESLVEFFGEEEFKKLCNHEAGHALVAFLFKRPLDYVKMNNSREQPGTTLYKSDPDYQKFQAACYYFQLAETNVVEQDYNILMACQTQLCKIAQALNERIYLSRADIEAIFK